MTPNPTKPLEKGFTFNKEEFIDFVHTMHLQNTSGRESSDEIFKLGILAAFEELTRFNSIEDQMPEKHQCVLVRTPYCRFPVCVGFFNGTNWIDTTDRTVIMNVKYWRPLNVDLAQFPPQ